MAQYQVPQFIEVEDKIFGPLTLKQFVYLAGGGGLILIFFSLLPLWLTIMLAIPVVALSAALAFYQVNGRPFIHVLEHAFGYAFGSKLYLWKQGQGVANNKQAVATHKPADLPVPKLSESKLRDLSWSLNIKDRSQEGVSDAARGGFQI